jgi:hypothetical protein
MIRQGIAIGFALIQVVSSAPVEPQPQEGTDPYVVALVAGLTAREQAYESYTAADFFDVTVKKGALTSDRVPQAVGRFGIAVLDDDELRARFSQRGPFTVLIVHPLSVVRGTFRISASAFVYRYRKAGLFRPARVDFALQYGFDVTLSYDCDTKRFMLAAVKLWNV